MAEFIVGGRRINAAEHAQLQRDCRDTLISMRDSLVFHDFPVTCVRFFNSTPPRFLVILPTHSLDAVTIAVPLGIPGNRGTESDGKPSVLRASTCDIDGSNYSQRFGSIGDLLVYIHGLCSRVSPEHTYNTFSAGVTD